ncbi:MAG: mechanosensitive ion channel [Gemmatimonadaceae bacterium]|nr:mechanosensitive ion channel [Gemmatimonadaceae bacterium]
MSENVGRDLVNFLSNWFFSGGGERLVIVLLALVAIVVGARFARHAASSHIGDADLRYRVRKAITFVAAALGIALVLSSLSGRLGGLTVAFGVAGAGIAFALQEVIASVAGWVAVLFGGFYAPGDRVQLGGIKGDVIDIGILRTTLMECGQWVDGDLYNGRIVRVANSFVFKEPVVNYSADFPFLWDELKVPITYRSDRHEARSILQNVANEVTRDTVDAGRRTWAAVVRKYRIEDARIEPMVHLRATDNWIEFTVRYIVDYRRRRATRDEIFSRILDAFDASGGRIQIASATFELVGAPPLAVQLKSEPR